MRWLAVCCAIFVVSLALAGCDELKFTMSPAAVKAAVAMCDANDMDHYYQHAIIGEERIVGVLCFPKDYKDKTEL